MDRFGASSYRPKFGGRSRDEPNSFPGGQRGRRSDPGRGFGRGRGGNDDYHNIRTGRKDGIHGEAVFVRYCKQGNTRKISCQSDALAFLESLIAYENKGDSLHQLSTEEGRLPFDFKQEELTFSCVGLQAIKDMINCLDYESDTNHLANFFDFLFSHELAVGLKRNLALKVATNVYDSPGFIDELISMINNEVFDVIKLRSIALFVTNVLSHENRANNDEKGQTRQSSSKNLIDALETSNDEVIQHMLKNNFLTTSESIHEFEPKHDNDVPFNYKDIEILPTVGELNVCDGSLCTYRGWLGDQDAVHAQTLDRQFRLLRDDFVSPLKAEREEIMNGGSRRLRYNYPRAKGVCLNERSTRGPCVNIEFHLPENITKRLEKMKALDIERFLDEEGSRILARDSIILFFDSHRISYIGIIAVRDTKELTEQLISIRMPMTENKDVHNKEKELWERGKETNPAKQATGPVSSTVTIGVWFNAETTARLLVNKNSNRHFAHFACVAKSSFFSFEPILNRLQG